MSDVREKRVELILQQLEELPTLPAVALRVLEVTGDESSSAAQVSQLIEADPALTTRILQLVRRADVGVGDEITSVERAVVLLGFETVRSAVLAVSIFQTFNTSEESKTRFSREGFWKHCIAVACCAELLAQSLAREGQAAKRGTNQVVEPCDAFICGLLHDMGKVALDAVLPKSFSRVVEAADMIRGNIADLERTVIGLDHLVVGKRLAERWKLPQAVRDSAWLHGQPPQALPANLKNPRLVNLITLADLLVREQHLGYSGNYTFPVSRQSLLEATGLSLAQVESAMSHLVERIEARAQALGLGQASCDELYQQALAQANKELGRVSGQLAAKNRKLTVRSKFFDALSVFQSELRPDAPPQAVLQAIAQTAVGVLEVPSAAVFSLPPGQDFAETILCDGKGEVFETSLIDLPGMSMVTGAATVASAPSVRPAEVPKSIPTIEAMESVLPAAGASSALATGARPANPSVGDGPVLPAGDGLEWLISAISPRLAHDKRFWICLEADGTCIGGVVWGAPAGEAQRLSAQAQELCTIAAGWGLALRMAQIREEARTLAEQLADANRRLHDAQSELLRSKAMLSVGEMAAGAAHEMNNPLAVISGRSQLLAQQLSDPKHRAAARLIHEQSHRLSSIITELMDFAKPEPPAPRDTELAELVERAVHEAKLHNDPADREFEVTMGDVPLVCVDEKQVAAAITEVLDNAIHATDPQSGHVAIHAAFDSYSSRVVLTITDDGCGMDEGTVKRAFDPFFSNKPAGRRRGLGLAKALRWIESSGGSIKLESRTGKGARAIILLPAARSETEMLEAPPRRAARG
jgi:signal transduction histidine kinase/HD-like signal output (HDOD) protein